MTDKANELQTADMAQPIQDMIEFDGVGGGRHVDWRSSDRGRSMAHFHWIQISQDAPGAGRLLTEGLAADSFAARILLEPETRPRVATDGEHLFLILRGANFQADAAAEQLMSLRLKINPARCITVSSHKMRLAEDIEQALDAGTGPRDAAAFLVRVVATLLDQLVPVVRRLAEDLDAAEDHILDDRRPTEEAPLAAVRRRIISLRRHLAPQLEALEDLVTIDEPWLEQGDRLLLQEEAARMARLVSDIDALRERGHLIQEEVGFQFDKRINRNTYVLTLVASVMLPLNLITGAFGMNVGGIPGETWRWMFLALAISFVGFCFLAYWLFRRRPII